MTQTKLRNIIYAFAVTTVIACQKSRDLNGNFSYCHEGVYAEIYFKKDSMRMAIDNEWVKLSEWRKIEIQNDTLQFETFGEYREDSKAEIEYFGFNKIKLRVLENDKSVLLEPINRNPNFKESNSFWNGFRTRENLANCAKN